MLWTAKSSLENVAKWGPVQCDMSGSLSAKRQNTRWNARGWAAIRHSLFDVGVHRTLKGGKTIGCETERDCLG